MWFILKTTFQLINNLYLNWCDKKQSGEHERLCAMKCHLGSGRISPPAGFKLATPWSEVGSANRSATRMLLKKKKKKKKKMYSIELPWRGIESPWWGIESPWWCIESPWWGIESPWWGVELPWWCIESPWWGIESPWWCIESPWWGITSLMSIESLWWGIISLVRYRITLLRWFQWTPTIFIFMEYSQPSL